MKKFEVVFRDATGAEVRKGQVEAHGYRSAITAAQDGYKAAGGKMGNVVEALVRAVAEGAVCPP